MYNFNFVLCFTGGTMYFKKCMNDQDTRIETMKFSVKGIYVIINAVIYKYINYTTCRKETDTL